MDILDRLKSTRPLILGMGKSGLSMARFLKSHHIDDIIIADSRIQPPGLDVIKAEFPRAQLHTGDFEAPLFAKANIILASPGVNLNALPALPDGAQLIGDVELFALLAKAPIVAVTGSNGKSTVVSMLGAIFNAAKKQVVVAGNIGVPVLDVLTPVPDVYVLELSSFQLERVQHLNAKVGLILNLSEDHLDQHKDMQDYLLQKQRVYHQSEQHVINIDDPICWQGVVDVNKATMFSTQQFLQEGWCLKDDVIYCNGQKAFAVDELALKAGHQVENAIAACALADVMGGDIASMKKALAEFQGLAHRCEVVLTDDGVMWVNDSKATNVGASIAAIESYLQSRKGLLYWIAGGIGKGQDFLPLQTALKKGVSVAYLFGQDKALLQEVCLGVVDTVLVETLELAIMQLKAVVKPGDCVLFSPACSSFDQFDHFEHRGQCFKEWVHESISL